MADDIVLKVVLQSDLAEKSVGDLKQDFRDLNKQLEQTKVGTEEYKKTLQSLGVVKGGLQDLKEQIKALNPEKQFQAIARIGSTVASGFAAAQGAMALFGSQSEDLTKVLLRVQAAVALAQGLQGLAGFAKALETARLAMIAFAMSNPFTAIAVTATTLLTLVISLVNETGKAATETNQLRVEYDRLILTTKELNRVLDNRITALQGIKGAELEILELEKQKIVNNLNVAKSEYAIAAALVSRMETEARSLKTASDANLILQKNQNENLQLSKNSLKAFKDVIDDVEASLQKAQNNINTVTTGQVEKLNTLLESLKPDTLLGDPENDPFLIIPAKQAEMHENMIEGQTNFQETLKPSSKKFWDQINKDANDSFEYRKALAQAEIFVERAKWDGLIALAQTGQQLAGKNKVLADSLFAIEKALTIASIIVSVQKEIGGYFLAAASPIVAAGGPVIVAAAQATAIGQATAAKIRAAASIATIVGTSIAKFMNGGGGGINIPSPGGGSSFSAPQIESPQGQTFAVNNSTQTTTNSEGDFTGFQTNSGRQMMPLRAYVVETDITEKQSNVRNIEERAKY